MILIFDSRKTGDNETFQCEAFKLLIYEFKK
jgi:hypothetical protein